MTNATTSPRRAELSLSFFYFFTFAGLGGMMPFLSLLLKNMGLSGTEIGTVMLISPAAMVLTPTFWAWLGDRYQMRLKLLRITGFGLALASLGFLWVHSFPMALVAISAYAIFRGPVVPLADGAAHAALGEAKHRFATIRVWGSIGFAVFAYVIGRLGGADQPVLFLGLTALAYALSGLSTFGLPEPTEAATPPKAQLDPASAPESERGTRARVQALFEELGWGFLVFLGAGLFYYTAKGMSDVFISVHLKALGFDSAFVGLAWLLAVGCEVGIMFIMPRLILKVPAEGLLILAALTSVVRWALFSVATTAFWLLLSQALHAITFGVWYIAMVRFVQTRASPKLRATVQSFAQAAHGAGRMAGAFLGGVLFDLGGGQLAFKVAAGSAFLALLGYTWVRGIYRPAADTL